MPSATFVPYTVLNAQDLVQAINFPGILGGSAQNMTIDASVIGGGVPAPGTFSTLKTSLPLPPNDATSNAATTAWVASKNYQSGNQQIVFSGDAIGAGINAVSLALVAITTPGTWNTVVIDAKGRVISGSNTSPQAVLSISGDVIANGTGNVVAHLANVTTGGSWNNVTVNSKGLVTNGFQAVYFTGPLVFSGDVSGTASTNAITLTLPNVGTAGTYYSVVTDANGRVTAGGTSPSNAFTLFGDASGAYANGSVNVTLASVGQANTYTQVTTDNKGRVISGSFSNTVPSANTLTTARTFAATGDMTAPAVTFNGAQNVSLVTTLASIVAAGTYAQTFVNTKGLVTGGILSNANNIVASGDASGTQAGTSLPLVLTSVGTAGTYTTVTTDSKGRVISGSFANYMLANASIPFSQLPATLLNTPLAYSFSGQEAANQQASIPIAVLLTIPAGMAGSVFYCGVLPTGTAVFTLAYLRGTVTTTIGTISILTNGVFQASASALTNLNVGDILLLTAPATPDATMQNVGITILATKR